MKTKDIVCAVICMDQRLLIAKRSSSVHENIWEFPGGKVEPGETREQAVVREIQEELELCVRISTGILQRSVITERIAPCSYTPIFANIYVVIFACMRIMNMHW
ncbi:MAG: NUDIX domain-containing protein [[Clostridium] innocuum]